MKKAFLVLFIFLVAFTTLSPQNYSVQALNSGTSVILNEIYFIDNDIGYVVAQGFAQNGIIKTSDGGITWSYQLTTPGPMRSVYFTDIDTGYAAGDDGILKSMDQGNSWANVYGGHFRSIYFTDGDTGYAAGNSGNGYGISKTIDGGDNWVNVFNQSAASSLFFEDLNIGYAAQIEWPYTSMYKTVDAGITWTTINIPNLTNGIASIDFTDSETGFVGEWDGGIYKTTDGGNTWSSLDISTPFYLRALYFISPEKGFAVGSDASSGVILNTSDGGSTWSILYNGSPDGSILTDVYFPSQETGYAIGNGGIILKITENLVSVEPSQDLLTRVLVFPNPAGINTMFTLTVPQETTEIQLLNSAGMLLHHITCDQRSNYNFSLSSSGLYFVKVSTDSQTALKKIVIE